METSKLPFDKVTSKITEQPLFSENILLKELCDIKITSPNEQKEQENISKTNIQETSDKGSHSDDTIITTLRNELPPNSIYNYKKDFLVLTFDQTEDQNSIEYKRKVLSNKLMTDISFGLNRAFEFSFQDKIKNNIISTLQNPKESIYPEPKIIDSSSIDSNTYDNNFILALCSNEIVLEAENDEDDESNINSDNKKHVDRRGTFLGNMPTHDEGDNTIIEDEMVHAKRNYFPEHAVHIQLNYEEDEELDMETYNFFVNFIKKNKGHKIVAKVKLVLSYIDKINPENGKALFTNKMKNEKLRYWKEQYEHSVEMYKKKIAQERERRILEEINN
jgi:hypothetical protein